MSNLVILGAPIEEGAAFAGCRLGPAALRAAGLVDALRLLGHDVEDRGDIGRWALHPAVRGKPSIHALEHVSAWIRAIDCAVYAAPRDCIQLILGGDHSLAAGTIPALNRRAAEAGRKLFVLWLDAHADFHTLDTSTSGNLHGVPLAYVVGRPGFYDPFPVNRWPVAAERICLMGLRSVDTAEREALAGMAVEVHEMRDMHGLRARHLLEAFLDRVAAEDGLLHVSLDVDFLDPPTAPGVGTKVDGGPSLATVYAMMRALAASGLVTSLELAELNPALDPEGRTAPLLVDLAAALLAHSTRSPARDFEACL